MVSRFALWQHRSMDQLTHRQVWVFSAAVLIVCLSVGLPVFEAIATGAEIRGAPVSALWFVPFGVFVAAVLTALLLKLRAGLQWALLCVQLGAVVTMGVVVNWAMMSMFLIIIAWYAAMVTTPFKALSWVIFQALAVLAAMALLPNPDTCWVHWMAFGLQLCAQQVSGFGRSAIAASTASA